MQVKLDSAGEQSGFRVDLAGTSDLPFRAGHSYVLCVTATWIDEMRRRVRLLQCPRHRFGQPLPASDQH